MSRFCESCGAVVGDDDIFCMSCGARLVPLDAAARTARPATAWGAPAHAAPGAPAASWPTAPTQPTETAPQDGQGRGAEPWVAASTWAAANAQPVGAPSSVPAAESAGSLGDSYDVPVQGDGEADSFTMVFDEDVDPADEPDAPTFVFEPEISYVLVRQRTGEELALGSPAMVGKGTKATNRVNGNRGISREHLRFTVDEAGRCLIADNGSTNGTYVNDVRLEPGVPVEVADGATIRLADEDFVFQVRE